MLTIITLNKRYVDMCRDLGINAYHGRVENYRPEYEVVFCVSSSHAKGLKQHGFDQALVTRLFPGIDEAVHNNITTYGKKNRYNNPYLPIGSSVVIPTTTTEQQYLVFTPTTLIPQNIQGTRNVYYAIMAALYNIFVHSQYEWDEVEVVMTSMGCGCGGMTEEESLGQLLNAVNDYESYHPPFQRNGCIVHEPNAEEQSCADYDMMEFKALPVEHFWC